MRNTSKARHNLLRCDRRTESPHGDGIAKNMPTNVTAGEARESCPPERKRKKAGHPALFSKLPKDAQVWSAWRQLAGKNLYDVATAFVPQNHAAIESVEAARAPALSLFGVST